ncbi:MAG: proton-conducting membrane transporter [Eubacterium sp.]|nr:proton-conducting membrane transporter [Eubacterium sp.]
MSSIFLVIAVLIPIISGALIRAIPFKSRRALEIYVEVFAIITSLIVFALILNPPEEGIVIFSFTRDLTISLFLDKTGSVFALIVSVLWPFANLYAFEYMEDAKRPRMFFTFYMATYGVTLGIALAEDIVTMYFFYEMLTLVTIPLVIYELTKEAVSAALKYMYYSLGGAAFAFIGMVFIVVYGTTPNFTAGGMLDMSRVAGHENLFLFIYFLSFCGFSVKAAMFPFSSWLPSAGVAPTPVTALLHAVAVVKAGAFATIRLTYFCFGTEFLYGSWAQNILLLMAIFTIVYGCSRALKEVHFKRRLAYSTVSNLSYILFGVLLMTPASLTGAMAHMICHAFMKICCFFCAGAVIHKAKRTLVPELTGLGAVMPKTFIIFTISSLALMGVPGLAGFVSKWNLAKGAVTSGNPVGYVGLGAILISALLTAIYMMSISVKAFFPGKDFDYSSLEKIKDPTWKMLLPLYCFVAVIFVLGLCPGLLGDYLETVVSTVFV